MSLIMVMSSQSWLPLVQKCEYWKQIGTEWIKHQQALTMYHNGHHPLFGDSILDHKYQWYLPDIQCQNLMTSKQTLMERLPFLPSSVFLSVVPFSVHFLLKYQMMFVGHHYCPFFPFMTDPAKSSSINLLLS
jgi:hypothetical protein